jgi:hypothetical protein
MIHYHASDSVCLVGPEYSTSNEIETPLRAKEHATTFEKRQAKIVVFRRTRQDTAGML